MIKLTNILLLSNYKRSFWEEVQYEIKDLFSTIIDFFTAIYESICGILGGDLTNMFLIAAAALIVMLVAMAIINGNGNVK